MIARTSALVGGSFAETAGLAAALVVGLGGLYVLVALASGLFGLVTAPATRWQPWSKTAG